MCLDDDQGNSSSRTLPGTREPVIKIRGKLKEFSFNRCKKVELCYFRVKKNQFIRSKF